MRSRTVAKADVLAFITHYGEQELIIVDEIRRGSPPEH